MLYVISNSDLSAARQKANTLVASLKAKRPEASLVSLDHESATPAAIEHLAATQGLFAPKIIVRVDLTDALTEEIEAIARGSKACGESENVFVFSCGQLRADSRRTLEEHAEKFTVVSAAQREKEKFPYNLAQSLAGNGARAFALYHEELAKGGSAEALHGALFWKAKQMMARGGGKRAENIARGLVDVYHRARRGDGTLELLLEKFILSL